MAHRFVSITVAWVSGVVVAFAVACATSPAIDGRSVPTLGVADATSSPPPCNLLCFRFEQLCGYAPLDCEKICNEEYDGLHKVCIGQAPSCQEALQVCANVPTDASAQDAGITSDADLPDTDDGGSGDDASGDG